VKKERGEKSAMKKLAVPSGLPFLGETVNTRYFAAADDVVLVMPNAGTRDDAVSARENVDFQMGHARKLGRRCGFVVLLGQLVSQDAQARRVYAEGMDPALCFASALVVSNPLSRAIGSFFLGLSRPKIPTKLFESVDAALAWMDAVRGETEAA
jgi:hypothetical protein